jgi:hypothetical protein
VRIRRCAKRNFLATLSPRQHKHIGPTSGDVGNDVGPISAKGRAMFTRHCRYRPDRMLAQRLDVGNVGSMSEADIGPTCIPDIAFVLNY